MGCRIWWFECLNCGEEFSVSLEHLKYDEFIKKVKKIKCPKCMSHNWKSTDKTEMGGNY
jgi:DNA-directed RNA polymerase subunit RPC12/RpoP